MRLVVLIHLGIAVTTQEIDHMKDRPSREEGGFQIEALLCLGAPFGSRTNKPIFDLKNVADFCTGCFSKPLYVVVSRRRAVKKDSPRHVSV
jgi:hypothetical protein